MPSSLQIYSLGWVCLFNEEMTLRPTTSKATAEAKYYDDNDENRLVS
jgi:hypothetical protein